MKTKPGVRKQRTRERTIIKKKKNLYSPSFHHLSNSVGEMIHLKVMPKQFLFPMIFFFQKSSQESVALETSKHLLVQAALCFSLTYISPEVKMVFLFAQSPNIKHCSAPSFPPVGPHFIPSPPKLMLVPFVTRFFIFFLLYL